MATVLVVEDEPSLRASIVRGLSVLPGVSVLGAGSVDEARAVLAVLAPRLVVIDLNLPDGSGLEVLAALDRLDARVPVIVASAFLRDLAVPPRPHMLVLEKPVPIARLRAAVLDRLNPASPNAPFALIDYLQLAAMGRRSVRLLVDHAGRREGEVVVRGGEVWHASDGQGSGLDALTRLLDLEGALVSAQPVEGASVRSVEVSCEAFLVAHYRRRDDERRRNALAPAPPSADFDAHYQRGVEALLDRRYREAFEAFEAARRLGTSPSLLANLARLRSMGIGT